MTSRIRQSVPLLLAASALGVTVAATAPAADAATGCKVVISAQPWKVKVLGSGDKYEVTASGGMTCAAATGFVKKITAEKQKTTLFDGPAGFSCVAAGSASLSGDSRIYMGSCQKAGELFIWREVK